VGRLRRCDDRCHSAKHDTCTCWCGGRFHGAQGAEALRDFVRAWTEAELEAEVLEWFPEWRD
jgi:predicted NUDIX family phosphoesterase